MIEMYKFTFTFTLHFICIRQGPYSNNKKYTKETHKASLASFCHKIGLVI